MFPLVPAEFRTSGLRILFDVSFFIIVTTIGLNIVFGIIVDTFSELRDERVSAFLISWVYHFCDILHYSSEQRLTKSLFASYVVCLIMSLSAEQR